MGNPKDSIWEDWGSEQGRLGKMIGESLHGTLKNPIPGETPGTPNNQFFMDVW